MDRTPDAPETEEPPAGDAPARLSRVEEAYRILKRRILDNDMTGGEQWLELELADVLGMSRTPVREALVRLARDGLVEIRPRHGMRVLPVAAEDMREIYEILTSLESTAAGLAAARDLSAQDIRPLEDCVEEMDAALAADDRPRWARADERFHALLTGLAGNARLTRLVEGYVEQTHRVRMLTLDRRPKPVASNRDHAKVVAAIKAGEVDRARRAHRAHRQRSARLLLDLIRASEPIR